MAISVDITQEDILYAKTFLSQYLSDNVPEGDFSEGGALNDLVVKAMSYYFAYIKSELTRFKTLRSLKLLYDMPDDDEVKEAVNDIISNFFINRGGGAKSQLLATIKFSQRVDTFVSKSIRFNKDGTHYFTPYQDYTINKENMIEVTEVSGNITYEYDLILESENVGTEYNVTAGTFTSWDNFNGYIISVRNDEAASGGDAEESSQTYIDRASEAITVRNLINPRSIRTVLLEQFRDIGIKDVVAIGYGDPEMLRDSINTYVTFDRIDLVHIGNHQDIYITLPLSESQTYRALTETASKLGEPDRAGTIQLPAYPVYKIHSVKDTASGLDLPYTLFIRDHKYFYTVDQEAFVVLDSGLNGVDVTITYDTITGFSLVDSYLKNPDERVILANTMARAKVPVYIEIDLNYLQITGQPDLDVSAAKQTVLDYIDSLAGTDYLTVDALTKAVHAVYGAYIVIQTPIALKGTVLYPDGSQQIFYSENTLVVPEHTALGVTNRVCSYVSSLQYITFTKKN